MEFLCNFARKFSPLLWLFTMHKCLGTENRVIVFRISSQGPDTKPTTRRSKRWERVRWLLSEQSFELAMPCCGVIPLGHTTSLVDACNCHTDTTDSELINKTQPKVSTQQHTTEIFRLGLKHATQGLAEPKCSTLKALRKMFEVCAGLLQVVMWCLLSANWPLVCWFCMSDLGLILFQTVTIHSEAKM